MYSKVDNSLDLRQQELAVLDFWRENKIFEKSLKHREGNEHYTFYDGPPTANGKPHIGHILTRVIKDLIPRYRTMKGYNVLRKAGWDTHGLPVELEVEKLLGLDGKGQIEEFGMSKFIDLCKESVWKYKQEWEEMSERVGFWVDVNEPYITYDNNYIESEWWALKQIWDKGLLYAGHKVVPYCPRCGTGLSSHEVAQGYKEVEETSVYVRFAVKGEPNTWIAAWTTTPWTLPSNVALCVNPVEEYALIESDGDRYYLAKELVETVFGEEVKILKTCRGAELEYMEYEPLFDYAQAEIERSKRKAYYIICDEYVTLTDGTGVVHIAPAFGEDDNRIAGRYELPVVQLVKLDGKMPESVTCAAGLFCKDADPVIIQELKDRNLLLREALYNHNYPFCWRCHTPLIYYARHSWFIAMTKVKEQLLANNEQINWLPKTIGTGRFGNFLNNVVDWGLSRERYWGTPLPIWECQECDHRECIGSRQELRDKAIDCPEEIELHRPHIDEIHLTCPKCGGTMRRVPEVIDCWFDSGSMPFAQWHYPFENEDKFKATFPAQFISEGLDQTRGWFYTMLAISTLLFDKPSYENCLVLGLVLDGEGIKMSKHKGNVVDPWTVLNSEGADAVRWYFYVNSQPWLPSRFSLNSVNELKRKFLATLKNTYAFFVLYAEIDQFKTAEHSLDTENLCVLDRWVLSRLNSTVKQVDSLLDHYDITQAAKTLQDFVEEVSNWYVRRGRERYWGNEMTADKSNAYLTLYTVLKTVAQLAAPFTPFISEEIYQNIVRVNEPESPESVHLCDFPIADEDLIDEQLEEQMHLVLDIVTLGRACRNNSGCKTRQPLSKLYYVGKQELMPEYQTLVLEELNVKEFIPGTDATALQDYRFKPQLRLLGKRFGKDLPVLQQALAVVDGREKMRELQSLGYITIEVGGQVERLTEEELLIQSKEAEGLAAAEENGIVVALDTVLSDELIAEGNLREIVSKVQSLRKDSGYEVMDRINLYYGDESSELVELICQNRDYLCTEVLAADISPMSNECKNRKEQNINGRKFTIGMEKI